MKKKKNKYSLQKNIAFTLIFFIGANYIILLAIASLKIYPGFLMQLIFLAQSAQNSQDLKMLLSTNEFYLNFFIGIIILALWARVFRSLINSTLIIKKTNSFIKSLNPIHNAEGYALVKSDQIHSFSAGILRPKIYLSNSLIKNLDATELKAVKLHEEHHVKSFDPARKLLADFVKNSLPFFPFKSQLFESYEVLSELSADVFSQKKLNSNREVISALDKLLQLSIKNHLNLSAFNLNNQRIPILVGKNYFQSRAFFTLFFILIFTLVANTYLVSKTDIFMQCRHLALCFDSLFSSTSQVLIEENKMCLSSDTYSSVMHCINFTDSHTF